MSRAAAHRAPARLDASVLPGAKPAPFPGFIEPCHPTLRQEAPSGERWVHEIKFDGYRSQAHLRSGRPAMYTRRAHDWTRRFQRIADALAKLPAADLILDGEAVVADSRGIPDFAARRSRRGPQRPAALLHLRPALSRRARSPRDRACRAQAPSRRAAGRRIRTHPLRRAPRGGRRRDP
jgi:bifunctional non-homologous end joining protein LigD